MATLPGCYRRLDAAVALDFPNYVVNASVEGEHAFNEAQDRQQLADDAAAPPGNLGSAAAVASVVERYAAVCCRFHVAASSPQRAFGQAVIAHSISLVD